MRDWMVYLNYLSSLCLDFDLDFQTLRPLFQIIIAFCLIFIFFKENSITDMTSRKLHKVNMADVRKYAGRIGELFSPERVILFGSHATGNADRDSDVDLFVIMNFSGRSSDKAFEIRKAIPKSFPLDLIVKKPLEVRERLEMGDLFIREILEQGLVLFEKDRSRMD